MMYIVYIDIKLFYIISYRELLYRDICLYRVYHTSLIPMPLRPTPLYTLAQY